MNYETLIAKFEQMIRDGFLAVIKNLSDSALINQLAAAIEAGDYDLAYRLLGIMPGAYRPLTRAIEQVFEDAAEWVGQQYPKIVNTPDGKGVFRFDVRNPRAEMWLRNESSSLIASITDETRVAVKTSLERDMLRGVNPRTAALGIVGHYDKDQGRRVGGVIGLTSEQEDWISSTRRQLENLDERYFNKSLRDKRFDKIVREAIDQNKPLTKEQVEKLTIRYSDKVLKYRGDMIARTESIGAFAAANYESTKQVVESGAAREKDVKRYWDDAGDSRVRHTHAEMDETKPVGLNEPYVLPSGARLMHPHDRSLGAPANEIIGCRCRERVVIDWVGAALND